MNPQQREAWATLAQYGYNWALSDTEDACATLDHPELKPEDESNYHKWAEPYPRRCYCGEIGYTDKGRFYANKLDEAHLKILQEIFPDKGFRDRFGELYLGAEL